MRIAVISDIHGNLPALEAVLADIYETGVDGIVCLGDVVDGPYPQQTLDLLMGLGDGVMWVRGDADRLVLAAAGISVPEPVGDEFSLVETHINPPPGGAAPAPMELHAWAAAQLTEPQLAHLASQETSVTLTVEGFGPVRFCHGTARADDEVILVTSPTGHYEVAFAGVAENTVVLGNTHMPFDRIGAGRRVLNPGSVGMPCGHAGASWLFMGPWTASLRRTPLDIGALSSTIALSDMPGSLAYLRDHIYSTPGDGETTALYEAIIVQQQQARRRAAGHGE